MVHQLYLSDPSSGVFFNYYKTSNRSLEDITLSYNSYNIKYEVNDFEKILLIQRINSLLLQTNTIVNISPDWDKNTSLASALEIYPSAILIHQKG